MEFFDLISLEIAGRVFVRTLAIFLFAFLILRLLGRKHLAHLTYLDVLLIIALGSAVGDVMIYDESIVKLLSSMIAISVVAIIVKILNEFSSHSKHLSSLVAGNARLVIEDGKIIPAALAQEDMSDDELMGLLRVRGFEETKDIRKAFLEADGELSVIIKNKNHNHH